jgi:hypothetical protein
MKLMAWARAAVIQYLIAAQRVEIVLRQAVRNKCYSLRPLKSLQFQMLFGHY